MDSRRRLTGNEIDLTNIVSGPRAKRARVTYNEDEQDVDMADAAAETSPSPVMQQGMRLWNAVKDYKDPRCVFIPSKTQSLLTISSN
jgi:hypothetical protein